MTGRGIDQILPHPCDPALHEGYVQSAMDYVQLAETANGPIPRGVDPAYIWGAALDELARMAPDARIVNLETSITRSEDYAPKGINYRMSPDNAGCLKAAAIDCCALGNNHILDCGRQGLLDTLATLERLPIATAGAGKNLAQAAAPATLDIPGSGRVLVFSFGSSTSGIPRNWAATGQHAGVNLLTELSEKTASRIAHDSRPRAARMTWSLFRCTGGRTGATKSRTHNGALPMRLSTEPMFRSSTAILRIIGRPSRPTAIGLSSMAAAIS
jgi:poly-gamma-glutamate capsule biosynthesis protein CapA/YwtB (metallophosphatase superfamily)